ncbi:peptidylprolyl isomerase, partial [Candidatus Woesearchaeota archaeon CG_4_10_14_0_8_um_filter_47_5]
MQVKAGDCITVEYTGKLDDGTVFDSTKKHGQPLVFEVGSEKVIKGFEDAVTGMKKDEEKEIALHPSQAYGEPLL